MKLKPGVFALLLTLIAAAGGGVFFRGYPHSAAPVRTTVVTRGAIESRVTALGVLQPLSYVDVGAQVSGVIQRLAIQPGSKIVKGDLLIEIDPSVQQASVDAGRAALSGLRAQLMEQKAQRKLAVQQHSRQMRMAKQDATREEDVQVSEAAAEVAAARVESILAQIAQMEATQRADEARLGYTRIYAPMAGTVVSLDAREGQTLNATYQTPSLLRIADLSVMTVWTQVSEADVRSVKPGMPAYFITLGGDRRRWEGKVRQVLPAPPPVGKGSEDSPSSGGGSKVVLYTVLFDVDNADGDLMPQMTAQVSFVQASASDVLMVPLAALTSGDETPPVASKGHPVRVLGPDGKEESRTLVLGIQDRIHAEIKSGLNEGEQIITAGNGTESSNSTEP